MAPKSTVTGSYGAKTPAPAAVTSISTTTNPPMAPRGRRRTKSMVVASQPERGSSASRSAMESMAGLMAMADSYRYRIRGSSQAYMMSIRKFMKMKMPATSSTSAWMSV